MGLDPVFRYLKTDLHCHPERKWTAGELRAAHGIRGAAGLMTDHGDYRRRLTLEEDREATEGACRTDRINSLGRQARQPCGAFCREAGQLQTREMTAALFNLLETQVAERLESWRSRAQEEGRLEAARDMSRFGTGGSTCVDQVVEALRDEALTPKNTQPYWIPGLKA